MSRRDCNRNVPDNSPANCACPPVPPLLALYPGVRQSGWAALTCSDLPSADLWVVGSGTVALKSRRRVEPAERVAHLLEVLSGIVARWGTDCVVRSSAGGLTLRAPGREELDGALKAWADDLGLPLTRYSATEVRAAIAGQPNASKDALAHAVMLRLGLIGQNRSPAEWEAIAAGCYHLALSAQ